MILLDDIPFFYIGDMDDDAPAANNGGHDDMVGPAYIAALPADKSWGEEWN